MFLKIVPHDLVDKSQAKTKTQLMKENIFLFVNTPMV